jgi:AraC family transcriptional regulator
VNRTVVQSTIPQAIVSHGSLATRSGVPADITSQALDWPGVLVQAGRNDVAEVEDLLSAHHYLSLNADSLPVTMEVKGPHGFRTVILPPQSIWFSPAGEPVSLRLDSTLRYVRVAIDARYFERLLARSADDTAMPGLRRTYGIAAPQIVHLLQALVAEADGGNPGGLAFVEALAAALSHQLIRHVGVERPRPELARGGLSAMARRRILEIIEARLDARLTVEALAREVGLSASHFARAFKETMGRAPHRYLLSLRLERARRLLEWPGVGLSDVAQRAGFADQAHLTRHFKREFGVTPGALLRERRH